LKQGSRIKSVTITFNCAGKQIRQRVQFTNNVMNV
jgi:hypothetical protein